MVGQVGRRRRLKESTQTAGWCKGKMERNNKPARDGRPLYLEKAAGRPRYRALPEPVALTPFGRPLAWKQEPAALWPSARL